MVTPVLLTGTLNDRKARGPDQDVSAPAAVSLKRVSASKKRRGSPLRGPTWVSKTCERLNLLWERRHDAHHSEQKGLWLSW